MGINSVSISGNLTRDSELRNSANGLSVLSFSVAVNERRKNSNGEWEDYPNYIDCALFGKRAESISKFMTKGKKVSVSGRLHQSRWEKDGQKRSKIEVDIDEIELMSAQKSEASYDEDIPW